MVLSECISMVVNNTVDKIGLKHLCLDVFQESTNTCRLLFVESHNWTSIRLICPLEKITIDVEDHSPILLVSLSQQGDLSLTSIVTYNKTIRLGIKNVCVFHFRIT